MQRLLWIVGATIGSAAGWWLGDKIGGTMTAFVLSTIGTIAGVYVGFKLARKLME